MAAPLVELCRELHALVAKQQAATPVRHGGCCVQRHKQIRMQAPLFTANNVKIAALQQQREKSLGEVLRFFRSIASAPYESVKRPPIRATEFLQRLVSCWRSPLRR